MDIVINIEGRETDLITENLVQRITQKVVEEINASTVETIKENAARKINFGIDQLLEHTLIDFMDRKVLITDKWGDKVVEYENVDEMLKEKFDEYITQRVSKKGEPENSCSYSRDNFTRISYLLDNKVSAFEDKCTKDIADAANSVVKRIERKMKETFNDSLKEKVAEQIFSKIEI